MWNVHSPRHKIQKYALLMFETDGPVTSLHLQASQPPITKCCDPYVLHGCVYTYFTSFNFQQGAADQSALSPNLSYSKLVEDQSHQIFSTEFSQLVINLELQGLQGFTLPFVSEVRCVGYFWSSTLSPVFARSIKKAHRQFFDLGSMTSGCFAK